MTIDIAFDIFAGVVLILLIPIPVVVVVAIIRKLWK